MTIGTGRSQRLNVGQPADVSRLRQEVMAAARAIGMNVQEQEALRIVASELGNNIIKHAGAGSAAVEVSPIEQRITIITRNPSNRVETSGLFENGHSTAGTLGIGLGAVQRLCDSVDLSIENGEFVVCAMKKHVDEAPSFIETSVLSRPLPGFEENGDGYYIRSTADFAVLAVIDGLGHGQYAAAATSKAISVIASDDRASLLDIVQRVHVAIHRMRGCVIGFARITPEGKMEYVGVGNIRAHIFYPSGETKSLLSYSGVVGGSMRTLRVMLYEIPPRAMLVMYSDGVGHISVDRYALSRSVMDVASDLFDKNAKQTDDATILVARMK